MARPIRPRPHRTMRPPPWDSTASGRARSSDSIPGDRATRGGRRASPAPGTLGRPPDRARFPSGRYCPAIKTALSTSADRPRWLAAVAATAAALLLLDLGFLGIVARGFYDAQLGALRRPDVYLPAAAAFYAMYVAAIVVLAAAPAAGPKNAALRGSLLGGLCYGTYELTNWAVVAGWPAPLVAVDLAWGIALTAAAAALARAVLGVRWTGSRI